MINWLNHNLALLAQLTLTHVYLAAIPIIASFVISVPLGALAARWTPARTLLLGVGNVLYTIPSIALVLFLPAILGTSILDDANIIVMLTIYGVALMVRAAADGFASVDVAVDDSAIAMGFTPLQRFFRVDLPLAGPVLLAGIRVVSVSTVSLVSIGALIGNGALGYLFTNGFQRAYPEQVIWGIIAIVLIALIFDLIIQGIGRLLMPWRAIVAPRKERRRERLVPA